MKTHYDFIIDFSMQGEEIHIFELGDFYTSSSLRLNRLRKEQGQDSIEQEQLDYLSKRYPDAIYMEDKDIFTTNLTFHDFSQKKVENFPVTGKENFINALLQSRAVLEEDTSVRPFIASVLLLPTVETRLMVQKAQKNPTTRFHVVNYPMGVLREACRDKVVFHAFTREALCCPPTMLLDIRLSLSQLNDFFEKNPAEYYVIKPTHSTMSFGIQVLSQQACYEFLEQLQLYAENKKNSSKRVNDWVEGFNAGNYFILVQTCMPSDEITYQSQTYRPTGRMFLRATLTEDTSACSLECIGAYWELPDKPALEFSNASLLSSNNDECIVLPLSEKQQQNTLKQLREQLLPVLVTLHTTSLENLSNYFQQSPSMMRYADYLKLASIIQPEESGYISKEQQAIITIDRLFNALKWTNAPHFHQALIPKKTVLLPVPQKFFEEKKNNTTVTERLNKPGLPSSTGNTKITNVMLSLFAFSALALIAEQESLYAPGMIAFALGLFMARTRVAYNEYTRPSNK